MIEPSSLVRSSHLFCGRGSSLSAEASTLKCLRADVAAQHEHDPQHAPTRQLHRAVDEHEWKDERASDTLGASARNAGVDVRRASNRPDDAASEMNRDGRAIFES